jgi:hypothetical protein
VHFDAPSETSSEKQQLEVLRRLGAQAKALREAAAYLPAGRSWAEALAKRRLLFAEESKHARSGAFVSKSNYIERFYRLEEQIQDAYRALGITSCVGKSPRPPTSG